MRPLIFLVSIIPSFACAAQGAHDRANLAYEDDFVWYVAGRLAYELVDFQSRFLVQMNEVEVADTRDQYVILYHHYLVECDGPLPKIADSLKFFDLSSKGSLTSAMAYVGMMESVIWPIVREWNGRIYLKLMDTYSKGQYGFFPPCVVSGFRAQNNITGIPSR
jgi:hypothetical protein